MYAKKQQQPQLTFNDLGGSKFNRQAEGDHPRPLQGASAKGAGRWTRQTAQEEQMRITQSSLDPAGFGVCGLCGDSLKPVHQKEGRHA